MIEFTLTELVLFSWAALATGFALKYHHDFQMSRFFLHKIITDEKVRTELVASYEKFERSSRA